MQIIKNLLLGNVSGKNFLKIVGALSILLILKTIMLDESGGLAASVVGIWLAFVSMGYIILNKTSSLKPMQILGILICILVIIWIDPGSYISGEIAKINYEKPNYINVIITIYVIIVGIFLIFYEVWDAIFTAFNKINYSGNE